jgi:predicted  nucleic acid-binding Zn-ribbon protein
VLQQRCNSGKKEITAMNRSHLLYRLQTIDLEIDGGKRRLEEVEAGLGESEELRQARRALQKAEDELNRWRTILRDLELEARSLTAKITSVEKRLYGGRITNPKELASLQNEVSYLKRRRGELEDRQIEAMVEVEEHEAEADSKKASLAEIEAEWNQTQKRLTEERSELEERLAHLQKDRGKVEGTIGAEDLALYGELCGRKGGQAVALLKEGVCQTCMVTLPTSQVQQARSGDSLSFCSSCQRILYVEL